VGRANVLKSGYILTVGGRTVLIQALKNAGLDFWEELLLLALFNIIWCLGTVLVLPWPFVTFGLFFTVRDIGDGKAIKFTTFFEHARRQWKLAYLWGGVNLAVVLLLGINIRFYNGLETQWAAFLQVLMIAILMIWLVLQLVALPIYPRLEEPTLKLALQNGLVVIGRYPVPMVILIILVGLISLIAVLFPPFLMLSAVALIAVLANRLVAGAIERELGRES